MSRSHDTVVTSRWIDSPPEPIFELLADPTGHVQIDGSNTLVQAVQGSHRLTVGDEFIMRMDNGNKYQTRNVVVEFKENRSIAWRTLAPSPLDRVITGRTWRYELEPFRGGTIVTEIWDLSTEAVATRWLVRRLMSQGAYRGMSRTLRRIDEIVTGDR